MIPIISIRQPWAWLVVKGFKDFENRGRVLNVRGECFVHASKQLDRDCEAIREAVMLAFGITMPDTFERGGIIGRMFIVKGVRERSRSVWSEGSGYVLDPSRARVCKLFPMRGQLGVWRVDGLERSIEWEPLETPEMENANYEVNP